MRRRLRSALLGLLILAAAPPARASPLILNEYNSVGATKYLNGGTATVDGAGNVPPPADPFFGRVLGNGGDWFELVVVADGLDVRGWKLDIFVAGFFHQRLVFTQNPLWSNLAAGTIITVAEDVPDDPSYDPASGDFWIHVRAADVVSGGTGTYITAANFPTGNEDWQLEILDPLDNVVTPRTGEGTVAGVGVSSVEVFKLHADPSALVEPDSNAYQDGFLSTFGAPNLFGGGTNVQIFDALRQLLPLPDRDGDGAPDDGDHSGVAGDAPCLGGAALCDDNCPFTGNPVQLDANLNGRGDGCECGDADDDGALTAGDGEAIGEHLAGNAPAPFALDKCGVAGAGACDLLAKVVVERAAAGLPPGVAFVCEAAAEPADPTDLVFDPDRLLDISITMSPADWDLLRMETRNLSTIFGGDCMSGPFQSPFNFYSADVTIDGQPLRDVGIRKKGFLGSLDSEKPSLKLDFTEFVAGQLFSGMERMTLNNAKQDPALVDQCLGYQLFAAAGVPASRCNFALVTVNGAPLGVYVHVESIKEPFLERHFADFNGNLYEGTLSDFRPVWIDTFEKKTNVADLDRSDLERVRLALEAPDADLVAALDPVVDLDAFYTYWALEGILGHWDGYQSNRNNFWVYFAPSTGKMHLIPWGIDALFAGGNPFTGDASASAPVAFPRAMLARRLYLYPPTQAAFLARVQELMDTVWDADALVAEIDRMRVLLEPHDAAFGANLPALADWIVGREAEVAAELAAPTVWTDPLDDAQCLQVVGAFDASFANTWGSLAASNGTGTWSGTYEGAPLAFLDVLSGSGDENGQGVVRVVGLETFFPVVSAKVLQVTLPLAAVFTGSSLPIEEDFSGVLVQIPELGLPDVLVLGFVTNGTIGFSQASTLPGAPVVGTIHGDFSAFRPVVPP